MKIKEFMELVKSNTDLQESIVELLKEETDPIDFDGIVIERVGWGTRKNSEMIYRFKVGSQVFEVSGTYSSWDSPYLDRYSIRDLVAVQKKEVTVTKFLPLSHEELEADLG